MENEIKNGSPIFNLCKKALPQFKDELHQILSNGKSVNIWQDVILGKPPPYLPRLNQWLVVLGIKTIWDISEWETTAPNRWAGWDMPECLDELKDERKLLMNHLAGIASVAKLKKDRRGWGRQSGSYSASEGYQKFAATYNVPINLAI